MAPARFTLVAAALAVSVQVARVHGHGYMLVPKSQFKDSTTSAWVVQIEPTWASDGWDGNNQGSVDTYVSLAKENGVKDIRTLLDDTSKYGEDCGFTDPNGTPQDVPTDGKAVFSRGMVHVGPCEIWLDDTKVLSDDNCYDTYGGEDQDVKSVFPIDYSVCETSGCSMMRFYWLAFQGVDGDTVWQVYKNCIPLNGGSGKSTPAEETADESETTEEPVSDNEDTDDNGEGDEEMTEAPASDDNDDVDSEAETTEAPAADDDEDEDESEPTPSPSANSTSSTPTSTGVPDGTWPTSKGTVQFDKAYTVAAGETFDGGMKTYERSNVKCDGQKESGSSTAVFLVEAGGTLKNAIIGVNQMEGVHCDDSGCTIENVWWDDVCEDALSIKGGSPSSVSNVIGGGARSADDKVVQHNGYGTVNIKGFYAQDFGKLYRSCGTCGDRQRFVNVQDVYVVNPGKSVVTVNDNYGDEATLSNVHIKSDDDSYDVCAWSQASEDGEPEELGAGIKAPLCQYAENDIHIV